MIRRVKNFSVMLLATIIILGTFGVNIVSANSTEIPFVFHFNWDNYTVRAKKDTTSKVKMTCEAMTYNNETYQARVMGAENESTSVWDCSGGFTYTFCLGDTWFMTNYVREWGCTYAAVYAISISGDEYVAEGVWQADY